MLTGLLSGILLGTLIISLSQSECAHGQQRNSEPYGRNEQNAARPTPTPTPNPREREKAEKVRSSFFTVVQGAIILRPRQGNHPPPRQTDLPIPQEMHREIPR